MHAYIFLMSQLGGPQSKIPSVAMSTPSTRILVSSASLHQKQAALFGEMAYSKTGAENTPGGPGAFVSRKGWKNKKSIW